MMVNRLLFLSCLLALVACGGKSTSDPAGYCKAVTSETGLITEKAMQEVVYQVRQVPLEYQVLQDVGAQTNQAAFERAMEESKGLRYFEMRLQPVKGASAVTNQGVHSEADWKQRDEYLSFNLGRHLSMVVNNDTIPCAFAHRVASHDMTPFTSFWLGFEGPANAATADVQLIYNDPFFNHGPLKFLLSGEALNALPTIQFRES